jgi:hypothetical protein
LIRDRNGYYDGRRPPDGKREIAMETPIQLQIVLYSMFCAVIALTLWRMWIGKGSGTLLIVAVLICLFIGCVPPIYGRELGLLNDRDFTSELILRIGLVLAAIFAGLGFARILLADEDEDELGDEDHQVAPGG